MEEIKSSNCSIKKIGEIIAKDIGMSTKILQMANSAFFGFSQTIGSAGHAVEVLGLDTIRAMVLTYHIFSEFDKTKIKGFSIDILWNHCMNTGALALKIAKSEKMDVRSQQSAFTAGLVHDIGLLIVAQNFPDQLQEALSLAHDKHIELWRAEEEIFHASHGAVGAYLLGLWGLPDPIVETVAYHHCPGEHVELGFCHLTVVHVAHVLENELNHSSLNPVPAVFDEVYLKELGVWDHLPRWRKICNNLDQEIKDD